MRKPRCREVKDLPQIMYLLGGKAQEPKCSATMQCSWKVQPAKAWPSDSQPQWNGGCFHFSRFSLELDMPLPSRAAPQLILGYSSVVGRPAAKALPGNLLEMQNLWPYPRWTKLESAFYQSAQMM